MFKKANQMILNATAYTNSYRVRNVGQLEDITVVQAKMFHYNVAFFIYVYCEQCLIASDGCISVWNGAAGFVRVALIMPKCLFNASKGDK